MIKKGYYGRGMATLKAWKRSVNMISWWSLICKFLCVGGIQKGLETDKFNDFRGSKGETESIIGIYAKN